MIKARTFVAAAVLAAAPLMLSATASLAATSGHSPGTFFDQTQTVAGQQATFIQGGDDLGRGAAEVVSGTYFGAPQAILDIPADVLGLPKPIMYVP
jgi:hypothetical protein